MGRTLLIGQNLIIRQIMSNLTSAKDAEIVINILGDDIILRDDHYIHAGGMSEMRGDQCQGGVIEMIYLEGNVSPDQIGQGSQPGRTLTGRQDAIVQRGQTSGVVRAIGQDQSSSLGWQNPFAQFRPHPAF